MRLIVSVASYIVCSGSSASFAGPCDSQARRTHPEYFESLLVKAMGKGTVSDADVHAMLANPELKSPVRHRGSYKNLDFDKGFLRILSKATDAEKLEIRWRARRVLEKRKSENGVVEEAEKDTKGVFFFKRRPEFHSFPLSDIPGGRLLTTKRGEVFAITVENQQVFVREFASGDARELSAIKGKEVKFTWDAMELSNGKVVLARVAESWLSVVDLRSGELLAQTNLETTNLPLEANDEGRVLVPHVFEKDGQAMVVVAMNGISPFVPEKSHHLGLMNVAENKFAEANLASGLMNIERADNGRLYAYGATPTSVYIFDFTTNQRSVFKIPTEKGANLIHNSQSPRLFLDQHFQPQVVFVPPYLKDYLYLDQKKSDLLQMTLSMDSIGGTVLFGVDNKGMSFAVALDRDGSQWHFLPLTEGAREVTFALPGGRTGTGYHNQGVMQIPHATFLAAWERTETNEPAALHVASTSEFTPVRIDVPQEFNISEKLWPAVRHIDGSYLQLMRSRDNRITLYQIYGPE